MFDRDHGTIRKSGCIPIDSLDSREWSIVTEEITYMTRKSEIDPAICKGCGSCAAECPTGAITA